jgi:hypothetical protein
MTTFAQKKKHRVLLSVDLFLRRFIAYIYGLFNEAVSTSEYMVLHDRMICELGKT